MALVVLTTTDFALLVDPVNTRVRVPHLTAAPLSERWNGTAVAFAGDTLPTGFVGEGGTATRSLTCLYGGTEQNDLAALIRLFRTAREQPDPRLLFRTHIGQVGDLDPVMAVLCLGYDLTPQAGQIQTLTVQVQAVQWEGWD